MKGIRAIAATLLGAMALASSTTAFAATSTALVRKSVEMSMLVTGTIDIGADGSVIKYSLDQPDKLPPAVKALAEQGVPSWRFEPVMVDGEVVSARAKMGLRVVANKQDNGNYTVGIRSTSFGDEGGAKGETVTAVKMAPPRYPEAAYMSGVQGTVYLILKIGRNGKVEDLQSQQVNLRVLGNASQMQRARDLLARAATTGAKGWTFAPPTKGAAVAEPFWSLRVPVNFELLDAGETKSKAEAYGGWQAYVPGPHTEASWTNDEEAKTSPDALVADGSAYPVGKGPRLLTPLKQG